MQSIQPLCPIRVVARFRPPTIQQQQEQQQKQNSTAYSSSIIEYHYRIGQFEIREPDTIATWLVRYRPFCLAFPAFFRLCKQACVVPKHFLLDRY